MTFVNKPIDEPLTEVRCAALLQLTSFHPAFAVGKDERGWYWEIVGGWRCRTITEVLENLNQWQLTANRVQDREATLKAAEAVRRAGGVK